jgi:hypothetical protein
MLPSFLGSKNYEHMYKMNYFLLSVATVAGEPQTVGNLGCLRVAGSWRSLFRSLCPVRVH